MKYILFLLFFVSSSLAMDTPIIIGGNNGPSNSAARYIAPIGYQGAWSATETDRRLVIPTAGTIYNLQVTDSSSSTGNYAYTLYKNGSSTSLTCNDSGAGCIDTTHMISVSPGDTISLECVPNSPDALYTNWQGTLMFNSATSGEGLIMGATPGAIVYGAPIKYFPIQSVSAGNATQNLTSSVMPTGGVIDHLYVDLSSDVGGGEVQVFVYKNGVTTLLGVDIIGAATAWSDLVNSVSVSAGDTISIFTNQLDGPNAPQFRWGVRWLPTTDGESVQLYGSVSLGTSSSTQYQGVSDGVSGTINSTESNRYQYTQAATVKKLYADIVTAVGVGNSVAFTVMAKQTPSALTCTISGGSATTCNDTSNSYSAAFGDKIDMKLVKSAGMPAGDGVHTGIVTFITPPTPTSVPAGASNRLLVGIGQ